jgi:hypothetical protein
MKLLKFIDGDAPLVQTPAAKFDNATNTLTAGPNVPKMWVGEVLESSTPAAGSYWLVDEKTGKLVGPVTSVVMMRTELPSSNYSPAGVTDEHVDGVDFRNALGKALEGKRAEYGLTFKNAAVKPSLMNHEERAQNRQAAIKREREVVADQISGKVVEDAAPKKGARKEKK